MFSVAAINSTLQAFRVTTSDLTTDVTHVLENLQRDVAIPRHILVVCDRACLLEILHQVGIH